MLLTSISLAVAVIPAALPALVTTALAFTANKLAKNNALIRKLLSVETLRVNKMTVQEIFEMAESKYNTAFKEKKTLLHSMALNNDVSKEENGK